MSKSTKRLDRSWGGLGLTVFRVRVPARAGVASIRGHVAPVFFGLNSHTGVASDGFNCIKVTSTLAALERDKVWLYFGALLLLALRRLGKQLTGQLLRLYPETAIKDEIDCASGNIGLLPKMFCPCTNLLIASFVLCSAIAPGQR